MGHVIAFVPASGGVGATSLAAAVAVRGAAAGRRTVAVDLDRLAGRLDVVLGVEEQPGWRWPRLAGVAGLVDGGLLARQLPTADGVAVLATGCDRWARHPDGADPAGAGVGRLPTHLTPCTPPTQTTPPTEIVGPTGWGQAGSVGAARPWLEVVPDVVGGLVRAHELTVLDLPREPDLVEAVSGLVDALVVVVGARLGQVAAAAASVPALRSASGDVGSAARAGDAWSAAPADTWLVLRGHGVDAALEDAVVDHLDLPLAGVLRDDPRACDDVERGRPPGARGRGPLVEVADDLLLRLVSMEVAA